MSSPAPTAPTPDPEYQKSEVMKAIRSQMEQSKKFVEDLRVFLRVPLSEFKTFQNPKLDLLRRVGQKMEADEDFGARLREFLEFCRYSADKTSEKVEVCQAATSGKVQAVLEKSGTKERPVEQPLKKVSEKTPAVPVDPEFMKKKSWIDDLLNCGYPLSGTGYYQIESALKLSLKSKPGFLGRLFGKKPSLEKMTDQPIPPHKIMEHLYLSVKNKKRSPLTLGRIQTAAQKLGIPCGQRTSSSDEIPLNPGFVLTDDGYCLVIDQEKCTILVDPIRPEIA